MADGTRSTTRRRWLVASGVVGTGLLAGCSGGSGGGTESPGNGTDGDGSSDDTPTSGGADVTAGAGGNWPQTRYDAGQRRGTAAFTGPTTSLVQRWVDRPAERSGEGRQPTAPVVVDGTVYYKAFGYGDTQQSVVYARDLLSGEREWRTELTGPSEYLSQPVTVSNGTLYTVEHDGIKALDPASGDVLRTMSDYSSTDDWSAVEIRDGRSYALTTSGVRAYDLEAETTLWETDEPPSTVRVGEDGMLFTEDARTDGRASMLRAYDGETGNQVWSRPITENVDVVYGTVVADGRIYVCYAEPAEGYRIGDYVLEARDAATGDVDWTWRHESGHDQPAVGDGTVYVSLDDAENGIAAVDIESGTAPSGWSTAAPNGTTEPGMSLVAAGDVVVRRLRIENRPSIRAYDGTTGEIRWTKQFDFDEGPVNDIEAAFPFTLTEDFLLVAAADELVALAVA